MIQELSQNSTNLLKIYSVEESKKVNAKFIEPEHVLLAIIRKKIGNAYRILEQLDINIFNLQVKLEQSFSITPNTINLIKDPPFSRRLQASINIAATESRALRSSYIGTEHFILAFAHDDNSIFSSFLDMDKKNLTDIRNILRSRTYSQENGVNMSERKQVSILEEFGSDLTDKFRNGLLDPMIGRGEEINRIIQILSRRCKNNPILVGEPGVGKTSIIEGLAARIVEENVPRAILNKTIISLDIGSLVAGTKYRGQFEERIKRIVIEVSSNKNIILFIDEVHTLVGGGSGQNSLDAADLLKPALARGEIQCIGATTPDEYRRYFERDAALARRFQTILVKEPDKDETLNILNGIKSKYELHHNVEYSYESIAKAVELSDRYITNKFFPDKAIDIIDESGAMKKIALDKRPDELLEIENEISRLTVEKENYVQQQNYEGAAYLRDEVCNLRKKLELIKMKWHNPEYCPLGYVNEADIIKTISTITGIPLEELTENETDKILNMENILQESVIGQDNAINTLANAIRRSRAGIASYDRPIGSFLFLGPTGVGKTLLAKKLSKFLFGKENELIRIDMSDFMEKHNVSRLTGAPPGYVGFENGGMLTEKIRRDPYSVILFDEIEKAHKDFFNLLLQILEEGELNDHLGHTVNFRNTVIIMTSNAGSRSIVNENRLGFNLSPRGVIDYSDIKLNAESEIKEFLSPEFINRIDEILVFEPLDKKSIGQILSLEFKKLQIRLKDKNITISMTESARNFFVDNGYNVSYGARPMRRLLQSEIENILAQKIISKEIVLNDTIIIDFVEKKINLVIEHENTIVKKETELVLSKSE